MKLANNILSTLSTRLGLVALGIVSSIVLARTLGPEQRGLFALVLVLPDLLRTVGDFGIQQVNSVYGGLERGRCRALAWQSLLIALLGGGAFSIVAIVYVFTGAPGLGHLVVGSRWPYAVALAIVPCSLVLTFWLALLRGMNKILVLNAAELIYKIVSFGLMLVFLVGLGLGVGGVVASSVLAEIVAVAALVLVLRHFGAWGRTTFDRQLWRRTRTFALPAYGGGLTTWLNYRADQLVIAALLPPEQMAFYVIACGIAERLWILPEAVSTVLVPHLANSPDRDPALPARVARTVMVWTGLGTLLVFVGADWIIQLFYSSSYSGAVTPLRWLLPGIFMLSFGRLTLAELLAREKPGASALAHGIAAVSNIVANVILIPRMGIAGAAAASTISYSLLSVTAIVLYLRETGVRWTEFIPTWRELIFDVSFEGTAPPRPTGSTPIRDVAVPALVPVDK